MRNRLIELLDGADVFLRNRADAKTAPLNEYDIEFMKDIAKVCGDAARILEQAVMPPVKIGQGIWDIYYNKPRKWEVVYLGYNGKDWFINVYWFKDRHNFKTMQIDYSLMGKMWYFSREEAEQALKEGAE